MQAQKSKKNGFQLFQVEISQLLV